MNNFELVDDLVTKLGLTPRKMIDYWKRKEERFSLSKKKESFRKSKKNVVVKPSTQPETNASVPADDHIFLAMKRIMIDKLSIKEEDIKPEAKISTDLNIDSLDAIELIMKYEAEFGLNIPDDVAEKFVTIEDMWKYISEHTQQ